MAMKKISPEQQRRALELQKIGQRNQGRDVISTRLAANVRGRVERAAKRKGMSTAEYVRLAVSERAAADAPALDADKKAMLAAVEQALQLPTPEERTAAVMQALQSTGFGDIADALQESLDAEQAPDA